MTFRMPAEWEPHERTLIGWPCRPESWGDTIEQGRKEFAEVANTIVQFEPVTLVCASQADAEGARDQISSKVDIIVRPMDGSWLRDNGPIFVTDGNRREARHFRFNAWGERHAKRDRDAALGKTLAQDMGIPVTSVDVVFEGGAISVDGAGALAVAEECIMHPSRNWQLTRPEVEAAFTEHLGASNIIWLPEGLCEDMERDPERMYYGTDGHVDLFMSFVAERRCLLLKVDNDNPNAENLAICKSRLEMAGMEVLDFPFMSGFEADRRWIVAPYLNFYVCNGAVVVPVTGEDKDMDSEALSVLSRHWPGRELIGITMRAGPMQGGAIHCLTQQVPADPAEIRLPT